MLELQSPVIVEVLGHVVVNIYPSMGGECAGCYSSQLTCFGPVTTASKTLTTKEEQTPNQISPENV